MPSCPTCGKEFDSQKFVNKHHFPAHGESIAKEETECVECGGSFEYYLSEKTGKYCSSCSDNSWGNENLVQGERENHTQWKGGKFSTKCSTCGDQIIVDRYNYRNFENNFCSKQCESKFRSKQYSNNGNPRYIDGKSKQRNYGTGWKLVKKEALNRDNYTCQNCGVEKEELGQNPDVHHKKPVREFDDPTEAHNLENLICLCRSCHMQIETNQKI